MAAKSPLVRFTLIIGILLVLLTAGLVALWKLAWNSPDAPAPTPMAIATTQPLPRQAPLVSSPSAIGGIVQDEGKNAVRGAKVRVQWTEQPAKAGDHPVYHSKSVTTNDQGKWTLPGVKTNALIDVSLNITDRDYAQKQVYDLPVAQVIDHSYLTVLSRGIDISGQVLNSSGAVVANATITTKRSRYDSNGQTARSGADGTFTLHHVATADLAITVTAADYAPQQLQGTLPQPLKIVMTPGQTIRGSVVDPKGSPIKGVQVRLQRWGSTYDAVDLHATTGADGKFELPHVPDDSIGLQVGKQGYQDADLTLNSGDPAPTVTLPPTVVFSGKVTDADTGKPIPTFYAFCGAHWPGWTSPIFNLDVRPQNTFHDGNYKLTGDGFGGTILAWHVRIEADGYYPQVGNAVTDGGNAPQDFQLHRGPDLRGTLVDSDGKPIANIPIVRLLPCSSVNVSNGNYNDSDFATAQATDAQGAFHLRPQTGPIELWAITKSGVAELRRTGSDGDPVTLKALPWAGIHVHAATRPTASDEQWNIGLTPGIDPNDPLNFTHWQYSATPTQDGDITFDRAPAIGDGLDSLYLYLPGSTEQTLLVHVTPGKTTDIDLTGGVTVTGRFVWASGATRPSNEYTQISLQPLPDGPPAKWPVDWASNAASKPIAYGYSAAIDRDGKFTLRGVAPGKYEYGTYMAFGANAVCCGILNVPADHSTFDAGSLRCAAVKPLNVGDAAPAILGRTLDDLPIKSADFAGKYVVWIFWSDSFGGVTSSDPRRAALVSQFGGDKRVAFVGINRDRASWNNRPPVSPGVLRGDAWTSGYVSDVDLALVTSLNFYKQGDPSLMFIIGPDGKMAAMNVAMDKVGSTLQQLLAAGH
jgi:hypothetical protein